MLSSLTPLQVGWQAIYLLFVIQDLLEQALQYVIDEEFFPPQPETVHKVQQLINLIVCKNKIRCLLRVFHILYTRFGCDLFCGYIMSF